MFTSTLRLALASVGGIYPMKALAGRVRGPAVFWLAWPGVIPDAFRRRVPGLAIDPAKFLAAWARMAFGVLAIVLLGVFAPDLSDAFLGLAGVAALLLTLHLGVADLLPWLLRWAGYDVPLLFDRPWAAKSLAEFWGKRWNLAFVEMNRRVFLRPFYRAFNSAAGARFALFVVSGLLHELGLSFPAGGGWGMPLAYFVLQGLLVSAFPIANRAWTWFWVLAPAPWLLFHEPFRRALIVPFFRSMHLPCLSYAIWAAVAGHLLVLTISVQVPGKLGWKEDIAKLTRFNQKVFWCTDSISSCAS